MNFIETLLHVIRECGHTHSFNDLLNVVSQDSFLAYIIMRESNSGLYPQLRQCNNVRSAILTIGEEALSTLVKRYQVGQFWTDMEESTPAETCNHFNFWFLPLGHPHRGV